MLLDAFGSFWMLLNTKVKERIRLPCSPISCITGEFGVKHMLGPMTKVKFPISETSTYFPNPPGIVITPNFDKKEGEVLSFSLNHPIFGERSIGGHSKTTLTSR